jgi:cytochrome c biogenesis protein CcdA
VDDKHDAVARTVKIDAGICVNGLVEKLLNCEISGFPLRVLEVFGVLKFYAAYAGSCLPTFRESLSVPSSSLIIVALLDSV